MSLTFEQAFIFDAAASAVATGPRVLPPVKHVVFRYLDAFPHAILEYLRDKRHVLDFLIRERNRETREPDDNQTRDSASDTSYHVHFPDIETERYEDLCSDTSETPEELLAAEDDEQLAYPDGAMPEETVMPSIETLGESSKLSHHLPSLTPLFPQPPNVKSS